MSAKSKKTKSKSKPDRGQVVKIALDLAAAQGWAYVSLQDVASESGLSLAELHDYFEDKTDILTAFGRMIDRVVLENIAPPDLDELPKDRLFDVLMERYEAVNEYRDAVISILDSFRGDPKQAVISLPHLGRSMSWMLEAAGLETGGITGALKVAAVTGVYLKVLRAWKSDESADLSKTMAQLDKDLSRLDKLAGTFGF